jgi:hypothetical protein
MNLLLPFLYKKKVTIAFSQLFIFLFRFHEDLIGIELVDARSLFRGNNTMGAETETKEKHGEETPRPSPTILTQDQFLSWKRQKVSSFFSFPFS